MPPPVSKSIVAHITRGLEVIREGSFCSGRGSVCVAFGIGRGLNENNYLGWVTRRRGVTLEGGGSGVIWGLALCMNTKIGVCSFSHSGDTRVISERIAESPTDSTTDITTGLDVASFAYRLAEA